MSELQYPIIVRPRFRFAARRIWVNCHVWLALTAGLLFALLGLTGSLSVYREELDGLLNPQLRVTVAEGAEVLPIDKLYAMLRAAEPNRHGAWTLEMPRAADGPITAWFEKPKESYEQYYAPLMVSLDPYTGQVLDRRFWGQTLTTWIMDLHTHLRLAAAGRTVVAWLGGLLMLSVISGLGLWWPGRDRLGEVFRLRHASLVKLAFDLHRWLGLISACGLLILAFTGFHLAYPRLLETITAADGMGHGDDGPAVRSTGVPNNRPVNLAEAVLVARGPFPKSEVRRVTTPVGELGTYRINLRQRDEINQHHPFTTVWVDRWSGQIRDVRNPHRFSAGQRFTTWLWPLHTGEAFGATGRFLWFLTGLTPALLYISGLLHWSYRRGWLADRAIDWPGLAERYRNACRAGASRMRGWLANRLLPMLRDFSAKWRR
ncbi:PepSY-associated TM helix domain-containing protein [Methylomonas sp. UP202]|uniref:PepSY-associated TM helix domain-containing protein n=1 Tax=Methylomonas sp. UP202 TaxID=3040943 RepID=UPI002479024F|nr:PepSY-associated TM helix domain-containing protein [Methylomonas sp. UP202]WGS84376.1 PepSY-associated TM helix domain-containing protein [Methylomonas sp. UP202]